MKRIVLIRHGKAEDLVSGISDFERSLTVKGKSISRLMAAKLREKISDPGVMITSPAFRAIETALIFAGEFGIKAEKLILYSDLYFKVNEKNFMEVLKIVKEETETVTLFGHNPTFTDLACYFCRESCDVMPKSGIVSLAFKVMTWSEIRQGTAEAELVFKPKKLL